MPAGTPGMGRGGGVAARLHGTYTAMEGAEPTGHSPGPLIAAPWSPKEPEREPGVPHQDPHS